MIVKKQGPPLSRCPPRKVLTRRSPGGAVRCVRGRGGAERNGTKRPLGATPRPPLPQQRPEQRPRAGGVMGSGLGTSSAASQPQGSVGTAGRCDGEGSVWVRGATAGRGWGRTVPAGAGGDAGGDPFGVPTQLRSFSLFSFPKWVELRGCRGHLCRGASGLSAPSLHSLLSPLSDAIQGKLDQK